MNFTRHRVDAEGWTDWLRPRQRMYRLRCCDCRLVHDMQFKAQMGRVLFRARRNDELTDASRAKDPERVQKVWPRKKVKVRPSPLVAFKAKWRAVECPRCLAPVGKRCTTGGSIHVARIAAGKAKRKGRHTGGRNKA